MTTTTTHTIITGFAGKHHCSDCSFESYDSISMEKHAAHTEWPDAISWDDLERQRDIEDELQANENIRKRAVFELTGYWPTED